MRAVAVGLIFIGGCFSPLLFLLTPFALFSSYFNFENHNENKDDIAQTAHNSLIKQHIHLLEEGGDCSECEFLQLETMKEFGEPDQALKDELVENAHIDLFLRRLQALRDEDDLEEEKRLDKVQQRIVSAMGGPSTLSWTQYQLLLGAEHTRIQAKKLCTVENAISVGSTILDMTLSKTMARGAKTVLGALAHMAYYGPSWAGLCSGLSGVVYSANGVCQSRLPDDVQEAMTITELADEVIPMSGPM